MRALQQIHDTYHQPSVPFKALQPPRASTFASPNVGRAAAGKLGSSGALQALRAFAALLVVLYHTNHSIFGTAKYWPDQPFGSFFDFGHAGVEFFFVLSGFIIFVAHRRDIGIADKLGPFVWKRFRRIYPVYWVVLALVVPLYFLFPSFGTPVQREPGIVIDSVLLMHVSGGIGVILTVSWTLFHELLFYGVFALLVLSRSLGTAVMGVWMAGSVVSLLIGPAMPEALAFYLSPTHLLFGMGMAAAWFASRRPTPMPSVLVLAGVAMFFGAGAEEVWATWLPDGVRSLVYGLGSTSMLLGAIALERSGRIRVPRVLVFLGNASYSVYLVHFVALSVLAKFTLALAARVPVPHAVLYVGLAATALAVGLAYHLIVEVPLLSLLGKRELASAPKQVIAPA